MRTSLSYVTLNKRVNAESRDGLAAAIEKHAFIRLSSGDEGC